MNRLCPIVIDKCSCVDPPVLNLSSEAPDPLVFVGTVYNPRGPWNPPCIGLSCGPVDPDTMHDCNGVVYSYTSQTAADLLAKIAGIKCDKCVIDCEGAQFVNEEQTATKRCDDGSTSTFTVPAGYFISPMINAGDAATWIAAANAAALAYAKQQVSAQSPCISGSGSGGGGGVVPQPKLPDKSNWCCLGDTLTDTFYSLTGPNSAADYIFTVTGGELPPGTSLDKIDNNTAELTGEPTVPGTYTFVISATRSDLNWMGAVCTATFYVFGITNPVLPDATVGTPYSEQLLTAGDTAPVTFTADPLDLPDGLTLASDGTISGTPTGVDTGFIDFDVTFTDAEGAKCTEAVTIDVVAAPVTCPWTNLVWGAPIISGTGAAAGAAASFSASASGTNPSPSSASISGTFTYNGPAINCNLHVIGTFVDIPGTCPGSAGFGVVVFQDGGPIASCNISATHNPAGTYDVPFSIADTGGLPQLLQINVNAFGGVVDACDGNASGNGTLTCLP